MKALVLLVALAVGCAAPAVEEVVEISSPAPATEVIRAAIAPELAGPARAAIAEWQAEGAPFIEGEGGITIEVDNALPHLAYAEHHRIRVNLAAAPAWVGEDELRRVFLHELGHVLLGQAFDGADPVHYSGAEESVMKGTLAEGSAHLGAPELRAWRNK